MLIMFLICLQKLIVTSFGAVGSLSEHDVLNKKSKRKEGINFFPVQRDLISHNIAPPQDLKYLSSMFLLRESIKHVFSGGMNI